MKDMDYAGITTKFLEFERNQNLLVLELKDIKIWEVARSVIFYKIIDSYFPANPGDIKQSKFVQIKNLLYRLFINSIFFNPLLATKKSSVLVFESGRKYLDKNNNFIDIYTHFLDSRLHQDGKTFTRYECNYTIDNPLSKRDSRIKHLDFLLLYTKFKNLRKHGFNEKETAIINKLISDLKEAFKIDINLHDIFAFQISKFNCEFKFFLRLFKIKQPKEVFLVNSCDKSGLIAAAKHCKIVVNELQHGLNSDIDIVSNFPFTRKGVLSYFPDNFYIWDNVNMFFAKLPLSENNIHYFKNYHIENWIENTKSVQKNDKTILFISQPYGSKEIFEFLNRNLSSLKDYTILYKLHPAEDHTFFNDKLKNDSYLNIRFINNEESLYKLMKKSLYAVGIYSSSLFEAEAFGTKIILLDLPGVEMSYPLLKNKENKLLTINDNLLNYLN